MGKFKVGDKVRVREDLEVGNYYQQIRLLTEMNKFKGRTFEIESISKMGNYSLEDAPYWWSGEMLEPVEYTYEDLCNALIGTKITFENEKVLVKNDYKDNNKSVWTNYDRARSDRDLREFKDNWGSLGKIIKIEEPTYTTVYEEKKEILDEEEKDFLGKIVKPKNIRKKVIGIEKRQKNDEEFIVIQIANNCPILYPYFKAGTMYKGMKVDKRYSLEELGL